MQKYKITTPICKFFKKKIIKETPRDRDGSFESQTVKKRETILASMANQIISKLIYTTNAVEGYYRQVCKVTKNKGDFPSDTSLEKLVYLAYQNICEMNYATCQLVSAITQLAIKFGNILKSSNFTSEEKFLIWPTR